LLGEFGIVVPQGIARLRCALPELLEDASNGLPGLMRSLLSTLLAHLKVLDEQIQALEREIVAWHRRNEDTAAGWSASPVLAPSPPAHWWRASETLRTSGTAARWPLDWVWCLPKTPQGAKPSCSVSAARSVLRHLKSRGDQTQSWVARLVARRNRNVAAVALANKNARIAWALLAHQREFEPDYVSADSYSLISPVSWLVG
jgi:hypothetical protein